MASELCPSCTLVQGGTKEEGRDSLHQCVYRTKLAVLAQRFRLLQKTLEQQQLVIEKQQRKLEQRRSRAKQEARHDTVPSTQKNNHYTQGPSISLDTPFRDQSKLHHDIVAEGDRNDSKESIRARGDTVTSGMPASSVMVGQVSVQPRQIKDGFISTRRPSDDSENLGCKNGFLKGSSMHVAAPLSSRSANMSADPKDMMNYPLKRAKHDPQNVSPAVEQATSLDSSRPGGKISYTLSHVPSTRAAKATTSTATSQRRSDRDIARPNSRPDFKYIEVVRNRDARMALPGHACEECAQYYAALGDEFEGHQFACSRHRAKWEPYATPEDFWRLSFPDSPS
ncbi:hypothetical protein DYB32_004042 [Aphanomyces invadans]|uniref:DNA endonuclease activator Ctp1 C-terminal domain-containing protein n=1 Tax=Aphanomyces invadans TaxID=157072 RepID=A0A418AYQ9_9STRA|nr:hypothetical protein DYB32_004042 [Aphanomyces invadans]